MPKKKKRSLTQREKQLLKHLRNGKTFRDAGLAAGYTKNYPRQAARAALYNIANKLDDLWTRHGLDDDSFISQHILPELNALETKFFAHEGLVRDERNVIAHGPRVQMIQLIARMKGMVKEASPESGTKQINVLILPSTILPSDARTDS